MVDTGDGADFGRIDAWRDALGLMPVPLRDSAENRLRYVLMNGTTGNFCLDFIADNDPSTLCATAWSCDVGHYVTVVDDSVLVHRWTSTAGPERYSKRSVVDQLHAFHRHLEKTAPDKAQSVVSHVLRVFRRIRAIEEDGHHALRALLHLLASAASGQSRLQEQEFESWGLAPETVEITNRITEATWRPLYSDLAGNGRYDVLRPDFGLVLRHAAGAVFEEAHLEAERPNDLWFPGFEGTVRINSKSSTTDAGVYFTPPALARTLAEEATRHDPSVTDEVLIFDPACGSGELLKECLRRLKFRPSVGTIRIVGWDKSPNAVDMARFVLAWESRSWPSNQLRVEITERDSVTTENWPNNVDFLLMNPPFKSWNLMTQKEQLVTRSLLGSSYKPNLALVFAHRAAQALSNRGTLAMIVPNSTLEASSAKNVRQQLGEILNPRLVARLGDQNIFARALVDAGMYVGTHKSLPARAAAVLWADSSPHSVNQALRGLRKWHGAERVPISEPTFSVYTREDIGNSGAPWIARQYDSWRSYETLRANKRLIPARKVFDIKQGVRLGNDAFVVTKDYWRGLPEPEQRFFRPAVMNLSISEGALNENYFVFYPYTSGLPSITREEDLEQHVITYLRDRLRPAKEHLAARKTRLRANQNWWDLLEHRAWQERPTTKIVSKYFGGARSFAFDQAARFVVVVGNAWLLEAGVLSVDITDEEAYLSTLTYLSSSVADRLLQYVSVQVSGGQSDLTKKYTSGLLVPNLSKLKASEIQRLVQTGAAIAAGLVQSWKDVDDVVLSALST